MRLGGDIKWKNNKYVGRQNRDFKRCDLLDQGAESNKRTFNRNKCHILHLYFKPMTSELSRGLVETYNIRIHCLQATETMFANGGKMGIQWK